jgi:hypothetical protein
MEGGGGETAAAAAAAAAFAAIRISSGSFSRGFIGQFIGQLYSRGLSKRKAFYPKPKSELRAKWKRRLGYRALEEGKFSK